MCHGTVIPFFYWISDDGEMIFKMEEIVPGTEESTARTKQHVQQHSQQQQQQLQHQQPYQQHQHHPSNSSLNITQVPSFPSLPSSSSFSSSGSSLRSSLRSRPDHKAVTNQHVSTRLNFFRGNNMQKSCSRQLIFVYDNHCFNSRACLA